MEENKTLLEKIKDLSIFDSFKIVWFIMIFVVIYYVLIAAPRYVSTMVLDVRSTSGESAQASGILSLLGGVSTTSEDINYLKGYIESNDMLKILDEKIKLKHLYQEQNLDLAYKIWDFTSMESYLKYYQARVRVRSDETTKLLKVEVEGFTPQSAYLIAQTIMQESEKFINEISHQAAREQMAFAEGEVQKYKERYQKAQDNLIAFQNKYGVFNPLKQAETKANLIGQIEANLAQKEAKLLTLQSYMNDIAPEIIALKDEIAAIKKQLLKEKSKISANNSSQKLNDLAAKFQDLSIEAAFTQKAYEAALKAYESARIGALRKIKQLVIIQSPDIPQSAKYPERIYNILTAFIVLSLIFWIIKFIKMIIEEHKY
ncbi:capsule biosynthesis protein [Campylobacter hepaticus]|uniref:Capsule biosynthesis protein n=1 Tax=Campylobacter hepaticus TaxID=1813019 RepID=A0A6A7JU05_9BACT|nr:capsule biosynthesis protein [Campylobacter hepaticus]AXP09052.1 capsule biosynthesis protein [Campylobacter hepaticus]MDX2323970.1 capsule biosynthesis protein [Campylobacter hepaticus]MDX2331776.1 capsule biosynthesis protein [Campylobacter hepaticus]MDX2333197.1 capsule biosynthesis protein [Campylobacter hepaticus]MDX2372388.1 capsule biosynthesis protein [Campylobacter hepaticus]